MESKDKVILHLRVPFKECLLYDYEYFNDIKQIKEKRIYTYEELLKTKDKNLQCCLRLIRPEWLEKVYEFDEIDSL